MSQHTPAIQKAITYLRKMIDQKIWVGGDTLPSIRNLASSAGVSTVPIWKAIHKLSEEGILEVIHGSGTRVRSSTTSVCPPEDIRKGWLGLRDRIHRDIIDGLYPPGSMMPSLKELRMHYGVSYPTIRKALDNLIAENVITAEHRTFRVASYTTCKKHASIVLLGWADPPLDLQTRTPWGEQFLRLCENICSRMSLRLRVIRYTSSGEALVFHEQGGSSSYSICDDGMVIGYLLITASPQKLYKRVLEKLTPTNRPVALLQEGTQIQNLPLNYRKVRIFSVGTGSQAAHTVANFLLQKGHQSVAYFSPLHAADWSRARLKGLQDIFRRHGNHTNVDSFTLDYYGASHQFREAVKSPEEVFSYITGSDGESSTPKVLRDIALIIHPTISQVLHDRVITLMMNPLFRKALKSAEYTAWVCANDSTAFMAMDFLAQVPERKVSIVSFDDTFEAFRRGLTSYNFNIQALVQSILNFLAAPWSSSQKQLHAQEINGILVERMTSSYTPGIKR
ncbi:MAG: GntR family transcriptional regulator [Chitinispirillaceae bacterium]